MDSSIDELLEAQKIIQKTLRGRDAEVALDALKEQMKRQARDVMIHHDDRTEDHDVDVEGKRATVVDSGEEAQEIFRASTSPFKRRQRMLEFIKKIPLFDRLTLDDKKELAQHVGLFTHYSDKTRIIHEGNNDRAFYILLKGEVIITKAASPSTIIARLRPGVVFGEISFLTNKSRSSHVTARGDIIVMQFTPERFYNLSDILCNKIKDILIHVMAKRFDELNKAVVVLSRRLAEANRRFPENS